MSRQPRDRPAGRERAPSASRPVSCEVDTRGANSSTRGGSTMQSPDTVLLVHGLWMTPRSWEHWAARYRGPGCKVLTPAYPGLEVEVEALRADPSPIARVTVPATIKHLEGIIGALETPPIIMGHSFGGALTQILLDHGFGAAGVAIDSVPTEGGLTVPLSQTKAAVPLPHHPPNPPKALPSHPHPFHDP